MNKILLLGRLGQDIDLKYTQNGTAVGNFTVATTETYYKNEQKQEKTEWHRIVVFGKLAELCNQYIGKGSQVFVEGKVQTRKWEDKQGNTRYTTEVVSNNIQFLGQKKESSSSDASVNNSYTQDDIPF